MLIITKKIYLIIIALAAIAMGAQADVSIDREHFPDYLFRSYVKQYIDANKDDYLDDDEIEKITKLIRSSRNYL